MRLNALDVRQAWVLRAPRAVCDWVGASPPESPVRRLSGAEKHTAVGAPVDSGPATVSKARCSRTPDFSRDDLISPSGITSHVHLSTPSDGELLHRPMTRIASKPYGHENSLCIGRLDSVADPFGYFFHSRVAELEQENARLLASIHQKQPSSAPAVPAEDGLKSELELLKRQLAETQQRERELAEKLSSIPEPAPVEKPAVKMEVVEPQLPVSLRAHKGERSGASFGLMVRPSFLSAFSTSGDEP